MMHLVSCFICHLIVFFDKCSLDTFHQAVQLIRWRTPSSSSCLWWLNFMRQFPLRRESRPYRQSFWEIAFKVYDIGVDRFCFGSTTRFGMFVSALDLYSVLTIDNQFTTERLAAATWSSTDSKRFDSSSLHLHTSFESASRSSIDPAEVDSWIRFLLQLPWSGYLSHPSDSQTFIDDQ